MIVTCARLRGVGGGETGDALAAVFGHLVLSLPAPYPAGVAHWVGDEGAPPVQATLIPHRTDAIPPGPKREEQRRDTMDVAGKVVLVTGASEGIGEATARLCAARGAKVALAARSIDKLNDLAAELDGALAVQADMTAPDSIAAMVATVVDHYGRVDVLINNAGRALRAAVADVKIPDFQSIIELNVYGPLLAMQAVIPHLRAQGGGAIINVSSNVSKMAIPTIGAYAATKYALNGLTLTARGELAADGIVVTAVHPGQTATNFGRNATVDPTMSSAPPPSGGSNAAPDTADDVAQRILDAITTGPAEQYMSAEMDRRFSMHSA